ncbi:hypothetical protein QR680_003472 [Steinernema hermaphroditum]|uniref:Uncharacterized protein n=1 Tax=Steinernema hermaphroditum TaxID=289476 RepID=A0AA39LKF8_9BILA|nr:hypothetical protein QR680_003472 [Steinernema hermaphroditum]
MIALHVLLFFFFIGEICGCAPPGFIPSQDPAFVNARCSDLILYPVSAVDQSDQYRFDYSDVSFGNTHSQGATVAITCTTGGQPATVEGYDQVFAMLIKIALLSFASLSMVFALSQRSIFVPKLIIENSNCTDIKTIEISPSKLPIAADQNSCYPVDKHTNSTHPSHVVIIVQIPPQFIGESSEDEGYEPGDELLEKVVNLTGVTKSSKALQLVKVTGMVVTSVFEESHVALTISIIESVLIVGTFLLFFALKFGVPAYRMRQERQDFSHWNLENDYGETPSILQRDYNNDR